MTISFTGSWLSSYVVAVDASDTKILQRKIAIKGIKDPAIKEQRDLSIVFRKVRSHHATLEREDLHYF